MPSVARCVASVAALCLAATLFPASAVRADTISVTGGRLEMLGTVGRLSITGDRGFSFNGGVDVVGGIFAPWNTCSVPECGPGSVIPLFASWSGNDLPGVATLDGNTYGAMGSLNGVGSMIAEFNGQAIAPPLSAGSAVAITAPFTFDGLFIQPVDQYTGIFHDLAGGGTATLWLEKSYGGTTWRPVRTVYEFGPVATPEPATVVLVASGLALGALRRVRRQRRQVRG